MKNKFLTKVTATTGAVMMCASVLASSPLVMNADSQEEANTNATATADTNKTTAAVDKTKWTSVGKAKTITRTIHYLDENGKKIAPDVVERHTGEIFANKVGDETTYKAFTIVNGVAENIVPKFSAVASPAIKGYKLVKATDATVPEQAWSLNGTQTRDPKTGFFTSLAEDEVINVVYAKTNADQNNLKDAVAINGYTVLNVKQMTRTVNFVDAKGNKLADSKVQTVKYETVASNKLTAKEQQDVKNQKVAVITELRDKDGNLTNQNAQILTTPSYKLEDVKAPKIKNYKLQNKNFAKLSGQYMWLSTTPYAHATLNNGLPQFINQDEIVDVVYVPQTEADKKAEEAKKNKKDVKDQNAKDDKKQGTAVAAGSDSNSGSGSTAAAADSNDNGGSVAAGSSDTSGDLGGSSSSSDALPQTGNKKASSAFLGLGFAMMMSSLVLGWANLKKKFTK